MKFKKILRMFGYDIKRYHPILEILLKKYEINTVLDIGANTGQFAKSIHEKIPSAIIYSFEPLNDCYKELEEKFKNLPNFKAFNFGLGDKNEETLISHSSFSPSSSFLKMTSLHKNLYPKSEKNKSEKVTIKCLDDLASKLNLSGNILIKVDVQGFEDRVIKGGRNVFSKAMLILVESSYTALYENQPLFGDINSLLGECGFKYYSHEDKHWNEKTGEPIYEDSIYIRKD